MTVKELIEDIKQNGEQCVESHIINTYVLYERKISICNKIVELTSYTDVNGSNIFKPNTPTNKMLFILNIINEYTDIDIDFEHGLEDFNLLEENDVTGLILANISETEMNRFMGIMDMVTDDVFSTRDLTSFLETKFEAMSMVFNSMMDVLNTPDIQSKILEFVK